jgi:hypothetical protein
MGVSNAASEPTLAAACARAKGAGRVPRSRVSGGCIRRVYRDTSRRRGVAPAIRHPIRGRQSLEKTLKDPCRSTAPGPRPAVPRRWRHSSRASSLRGTSSRRSPNRLVTQFVGGARERRAASFPTAARRDLRHLGTNRREVAAAPHVHVRRRSARAGGPIARDVGERHDEGGYIDRSRHRGESRSRERSRAHRAAVRSSGTTVAADQAPPRPAGPRRQPSPPLQSEVVRARLGSRPSCSAPRWRLPSDPIRCPVGPAPTSSSTTTREPDGRPWRSGRRSRPQCRRTVPGGADVDWRGHDSRAITAHCSRRTNPVSLRRPET